MGGSIWVRLRMDCHLSRLGIGNGAIATVSVCYGELTCYSLLDIANTPNDVMRI